jgi:hypothetical protein
MAFNLNNLVPVSQDGTDVFDIFKYQSSDDAIAAINTAGYFNNASQLLAVGDTIFIKDSAGVVVIALVASNAAGVVDITDGLVVTATDSD